MGGRAAMEKRETGSNSAQSPVFGTVKDVVARYCRCENCRAYLHFSHVTDFVRNLTRETARCPECGTEARQVTHRLQ